MDFEKRIGVEPTQHIRNLLDSIEGGKLTVELFSDDMQDVYPVTYDVTCTPADADGFIAKFERLTAILEATAAVKDKIEAGEAPEALLTPEQLYVWNTFIRELEDTFDARGYDIDELEDKEFEGKMLTAEESEILDDHLDWLNEQYCARMGIVADRAHSVYALVMRIRRYEQLIYLKAPKIVLEMEGCCLAEEIILHESIR